MKKLTFIPELGIMKEFLIGCALLQEIPLQESIGQRFLPDRNRVANNHYTVTL